MLLKDVCSSVSETFKKNLDEVVLVNTSDVYDGEVLNHKFAQNSNLPGQFKKSFKKGDILFSEIRPKNKRWAFVDFDASNYVASTKLMVLRADPSKAIPEFLFYFLTSPAIVEQLQVEAEARSGTFPQITFSEVAKISLPDFSIEEQQKIVDVLLKIDSKILNNKQINDNLFEQIYLQFLKDFIDSSSEDWRKLPLRNMVESMKNGDWGKDSSQDDYTVQVSCIRGADIPSLTKGEQGKMPYRYIQDKKFKTKQLSPGDIVVEISGGSPTQSTGRAAFITKEFYEKNGKRIICTNFCKAIKPKIKYELFLYFHLKRLYEEGVFFTYENGTTGIKNLDLNAVLDNESVSAPPEPELEKFNEYCNKRLSLIFGLAYESTKLTTVKELLLRKFFSNSDS